MQGKERLSGGRARARAGAGEGTLGLSSSKGPAASKSDDRKYKAVLGELGPAPRALASGRGVRRPLGAGRALRLAR
eukprot:5844095-Pyramimonas_sp.AAC.1